jgi:predicted CoA-substrate-specific enzyme activase
MDTMGCTLGIDVGSISTCVALVGEAGEVLFASWERSHGRPMDSVKKALGSIGKAFDTLPEVTAVGTTGSGRELAAALVGADVVKNEITAHALAAISFRPDVRTVIEIGGQDSKIIIVRDGVVVDFAMNTICAAGTGSFLDHQAHRLGVAIEDFGALALEASEPVNITGRCTVFAESDLIHRQQLGHPKENLIAGLCRALAENYLGGVGKDRDIRDPVVFQGGVAANVGMVRAFSEILGTEIHLPPHFQNMGAIGAALVARDLGPGPGVATAFRGFDASKRDFQLRSFDCEHCTNRCEIMEVVSDGVVLGRWGGRCPRWTGRPKAQEAVSGT